MENTQIRNHLSQEKSPYLRQHAANPVDWHPWNDATLALARQKNLPIFLSIGYSTCHWCHVMAHESFENEHIAKLLNTSFINIKVDREERPDVDALYMTAVQALTGSGGWPMSVWLTPDLKPFFAGTYFPPEDRYGRTGFPTVLKQLGEMWATDRAKIEESAEQITGMLQQYLSHGPQEQAGTLEIPRLAEDVFKTIKTLFDPVHGGFGPAPKFPMPVYMLFLLDFYRKTNNPDALHMVSFTMEKISNGGLTDHLGGGFARYSTDDHWTVPHFEKMLYDNAQLISVAVGLAEITGIQQWKDLAMHAIDYATRDLGHPAGGFYSAEDADSEGKEGAFYLWTVHEVNQTLSEPEAQAFISYYGLTINGNFKDPHHPEPGKNVLTRNNAAPRSQALAEAERKLMAVRLKRPRPHRDEKILVEWNGLMLSALAKAGQAFNEPKYLQIAIRAAVFIQGNMVDRENQQLYRSWCEGTCTISAQQSDYAFLVQGLLDLFDASGDIQWLDWASRLQQLQDRLFFDEELGGYFMNHARPDLLIRMKADTDNVIPSGNSIAVGNALRLFALTADQKFKETALHTLRGFSSQLRSRPVSMASLVGGLLMRGAEL